MKKFALFSNDYLTIPANQRAFSWGKRQVEDLIRDLTLAGDSAHYFGPIIVTKTARPAFIDDEYSNTIEYYVDDGQQRITTLFLFANEIRRAMTALGGPPGAIEDLRKLIFIRHGGLKPRLTNAQPALEYYLRHVLDDPTAVAPPAERAPAMTAMDEVRTYLRKMLEGKSLADLLRWKNRILNQAMFEWVDIGGLGLNRYLTFDAINSRGLPLSEFDKIKNFCLLLATERGHALPIESSWYDALVELQKFGVADRTTERAFIAEVFSVFHNRPTPEDRVHDEFVREYRSLLSSNDAALLAELGSFISVWTRYARSFAFLSANVSLRNYGTNSSTAAGRWLDRLDNMGLPTITRAILATCHMQFGASDFERIAESSEVYTFRIHAVMRKRKDANKKILTRIANKVMRKGGDIASVIKQLCAILERDASLKAIVTELGNGTPKYNYDPRTGGWAHCYYFLYEYELSVSPLGVEPLPYAKNKEVIKNTQEHILPQGHRDGGWWEARWDAIRAEEFKHRLGNLVLTSDNFALGRKPIAEKLDAPPPTHCFNHSKATNSEKLIRNYTDGSQWSEGSILKREFDMLVFAAKRWHLGCSNDVGSIALPSAFGALGFGPIVVTSASECVDSEDLDGSGDLVDDGSDSPGAVDEDEFDEE